MYLYNNLELLLIKKGYLNNEINMFVLFYRFDEDVGIGLLKWISIKILIYDYFLRG
jgi:hypothetical protein